MDKYNRAAKTKVVIAVQEPQQQPGAR